MKQKHFLVFSHGFGVRKDDRGLFTDIAAALKDAEPVMFDYNDFDERQNTLTVRPLTKQANILTEVIDRIHKENPKAIIDLVCHSQGSVVAGLSKPTSIRKVALLAPPLDMTIDRMTKTFGSRPGAEINISGTSKLPRRDGSISLVPHEYWTDREGIQPLGLYNQLADLTEVVVIKATQDEVLGETDFTALNKKAKVVELESTHDFTGAARGRLLQALGAILSV